MTTKKFTIHLNMANPKGEPIVAELTVSTYKGVIQCACLKQIKTWEHDAEVVIQE